MDKDVLDGIDKILEGNGDIDEKTERRLLLLALHHLRDEIKRSCMATDGFQKVLEDYLKSHEEQHRQISTRIQKLEDNNLLMWIKANPLPAGIIALLFLTASDLLRGVLLLLGIHIP